MYLYADVFDSLMLYRLFANSIDGFNYYGPTEVSKEQWNTLVKKSEEDETWKDVIKELKPWAEECFVENMCISICGI